MDEKSSYQGGSTPGMNQALGLPFGEGMEKVAVCFDVDGTLIDGDENHVVTMSLLDMFIRQRFKNVDIIVWSGGGADYARTIMQRWYPKQFEQVKYYSKLQYKEVQARYHKIVAFDDIQDTRLGDVNLIVRNK